MRIHPSSRFAVALSVTFVTLAAACGAPPPAAPVPPSASAAAPAVGSPSPSSSSSSPEPAASATPAPAAGIPASCTTSSGGLCVPEPGFVKRLCDGSFPDVALVLFAKGSPWKRVYMRGDVEGWNADGGASPKARLAFDEEVLVLRRRAAGGIVQGAGGGYLVMRWDGHCYTLDDGEVTEKAPPKPKSGPVPWRFYGEATKDALLKNAKVLAAYQRRGKECKGAISGEVPRACQQADDALSAVVATEVRAGLGVPTPAVVP